MRASVLLAALFYATTAFGQVATRSSAVSSSGKATIPLAVAPPAWTGNSLTGVYANVTPAVVGGTAATGTDTALGVWTAFAFAPTRSEIGAISLRLKKDAGVAAGGTIKAYLFSDSGALVPASDISDTTTGQPTIVFTGDLGTSYANFSFRLPKTGLTPSAVYWVVLNIAVSGGSIYVDSAAAGGNYLQTATDSGGAPGAWTAAAKSGSFVIYGSSGRGVSAVSANHWAVYGESDSGFGVRGISVRGPGGKFDSVDNYGLGGTSTNGIGVRGSSEYNFAGQFVSVAGWGGQFQGTGGAQLVATSASAPAMQTVHMGGGNLWQGLDASASYAVVAQIDTHGAGYLTSLQLKCTATLPACSATLEGYSTTVCGSGATPTKACLCTYTPTGTVAAWVNLAKNSAGTGIGDSTTCP